MATIEQIQVFTAFAVQLSAQEGEGISLDEIYDRWREETLRPTDALAVQASLRDMNVTSLSTYSRESLIIISLVRIS